jgi:(1->4)-alpha-D-glucan 1-alpha-D-glucosylmutase
MTTAPTPGAAHGPARPRCVPVSTYRIQFTPTFTFADATAIVPYLASLGITHVYASSYLKAVPGSPHGYDVTDPTHINPELGDERSYEEWIAALRAHGMGHILDLVPNHMGIARSANPWWQDVLENGESSVYADVFDIDWCPLKAELEHQVLLPVLGDVYGATLERQELVLEYADGAFQVRYFDSVFPLAPRTYDGILGLAEPALLEEIGSSSEDALEFLSILTAIRHLPDRQRLSREQQIERDRENDVIERRLKALTQRSAPAFTHIRRAIERLNGVAGRPETFDELDALLSRQAYRLAYWRVAGEEINYRRFFDINELAAIRMEEPEVFERVHAYVFDLVARGLVDGFRIDHVDGLYDPGDYLGRLQARARLIRPDLFQPDYPLYVVVEKILGHGETLPQWPVAGTTGYEFSSTVNGLFVDVRHERAMTRVYQQFSRSREPYRDSVYRGRQLVLRLSMASELNVLADRLNRFSERSRHYRDFTINSLSQAMGEIIASFPVYRTYTNEREPGVSERDRAYIERAVAEAKRWNPNRPAAVYDFVADVLLRRADYLPEAEQNELLRFIGKFQQVTSAVTARGIEDTAMYVFNRLTSLNEVGDEPDRFGVSPAEVHAAFHTRIERCAHGLSATSTHDTKRSEDVRARLNALSEMPAEWRQALARWSRVNRRARLTIDGRPYPSRNEEYLFYQTLLGSWPLATPDADEERELTRRIVEYMKKAMREAKTYTSWLNPSARHERAMTRFVEAVLAPDNEVFRRDFLRFEGRLARFGIYNSLSQLAIKICAPGVPDFYQGTDVWDFSLVDPDNRRPVDFDRRRALLAGMDSDLQQAGAAPVVSQLMANPCDDRLKLYVASTLLRFRRTRSDLFQAGDYRAVPSEGEHVFAFSRTHENVQVILAVPRLVAGLCPDGRLPIGAAVWGDTRLFVSPMADGYTHVMTGRCVRVVDGRDGPHLRAADVFADCPVALMEAQGA